MCGKMSEAAREDAMVVTHRHPDGTAKVWCDPCLEPLIRALNDAGVKTVASCCGHDSGMPGWIMLADGRDLVICATHGQARAIVEGDDLADAWDKGYAAGQDDALSDRWIGTAVNPFKTRVTAPGGQS